MLAYLSHYIILFMFSKMFQFLMFPAKFIL